MDAENLNLGAENDDPNQPDNTRVGKSAYVGAVQPAVRDYPSSGTATLRQCMAKARGEK